MTEQPEALQLADELCSGNCLDHINLLSAAELRRLHALKVELVTALRDLEVSANTTAMCYERRPVNFASALQEMRDSAERARAALAKATS